MEEFENAMGGSWGDSGERNFGDIQPMEALDQIFTVSSSVGLENISEDIRTQRIMETVVKMSESDLRIWASKMASDSSIEEKPKNTDDYLKIARGLQNFCSRYFGGGGKKQVIH
jgi:hypothetical protein